MRERNATTRAALDALLANVRQATAPGRLNRASTRSPQINAVTIKQLRGWTKLSQPAFAALLGVELSTLRNWEQGRREPAGPARALLRAIHNDPESVIRALGTSGLGPRRPPLRRVAA
jgi:putative transcriptional regulator